MSVRLAVTMRVVSAQDYVEPRDAVSHDWLRYLTDLGVALTLVPNVSRDPVAYIHEAGVQALLLTNGEDVWQGPLDQAPGRDRTEHALLAYAALARLPVFGVCRGLQVINVHFGGKVTALSQPHVAVEHAVALADCFSTVLGRAELRVNSYHRQGVLQQHLAPTLIACAKSEFVVEGLRHQSLPIWAVQWHPERPDPAVRENRLLLEAWLGEARLRL